MPTNLSLTRITLPLVLCTTTLMAQERITFTDDLMPGSEEPGWLVSLVVDDITGEPIAGAEVFLVKESDTPIAGEFWYTRKVTTDANGVMRVPVADIEGKWHMQVLRHPGYGTCTRSGRDSNTWRVGRAFDVPVLVLDWRGQPSPGAKIGFCGGCGHTPDLANATADENGIAVLRGIDPHNHIRDVYVQQPGLRLGYQSVRWYPGGSPSIVECGWSFPLHGRVVDHHGQPVAGAFVSAPDVHRGPWTRTAADGSFTVLGGDPETGSSRVLTADGQEVWFRSPSSYPVTLKLPDPKGDHPNHGEIDTGEWSRKEVETRKVRVRFEGSSEGLYAAVRMPGSSWIKGELDTIEVPTSGPFVIELSSDEVGFWEPNERMFAFDDASELPPEPVALRWFSPTRVVGRVVDPDGKPVVVEMRFLPDWTRDSDDDYSRHPDGRFDLRVTDSGLQVLEIRPENEELRRRSVWVSLPRRGDDRRVDLGVIVLSKDPQLRIEGAGGPLAGEKVQLARPGYQRGGQTREFALDHEGCWDGPDLQEGDALLVEGGGDVLPFRAVLRRAGPWKITAPQGRLDVRVTTSNGKLVVSRLLLGDELIKVKDVRRLRRLHTGPLRFYVSAPGYRTAIVDTVITTQSQTIDISLPLR